MSRQSWSTTVDVRQQDEWVQMWMAVEMKSSTRMGTQYMWVTRGYYKWLRKRDHEETDVQAEASWIAKLDELPSAHKCGKTGRILFNVEDFVIMEDQRSTIEQTRYGGKVVVHIKHRKFKYWILNIE